MKDKIKQIFEENVSKKGTDEALGYGDGGQSIRLGCAQVLVNEAVKKFGPCSLIDLGCGYGDLSFKLNPYVSYYGIDATPWIVAEAVGRYPDLEGRVKLWDQYKPSPFAGIPGFDIVVSLGVMACLDAKEDQKYMDSLRAYGKPGAKVIFSYPDAELYKGTFRGWTQAEVETLHGIKLADCKVIRCTGIHVTAMYELKE